MAVVYNFILQISDDLKVGKTEEEINKMQRKRANTILTAMAVLLFISSVFVFMIKEDLRRSNYSKSQL